MLFAFLLLLLPSQLGKHLWFDFSRVLGIRIDYLAPTLYLTDVLVIGLLIVWFIEMRYRSAKPKTKNAILRQRKTKIIAFVFLIFLMCNVYFALNKFIAVYQGLKILQLVGLGFYVYKNMATPDKRLFSLLGITVIYSSLLAGFQFIHQASIGGLLYWLGERTFTATTAQIATAYFAGKLLLRPYATFPHPNVLAGYTVVVLALLFTRISQVKDIIFSKENSKLQFLVLVSGCITLLLTLSRSAWMVGIVVLLFYWWKNRRLGRTQGIKPILIKVLLTAFIYLLVYRMFGFWSIDKQSVAIREELDRVALSMIFQSPVVGVGLGNFILLIPKYISQIASVAILQPVHNIYLLIAAETGSVGLAIFLGFMALTLKHVNKSSPGFFALLGILLLGLFDHYFITLQQTQLLFAIILGMAWSRTK